MHHLERRNHAKHFPAYVPHADRTQHLPGESFAHMRSRFLPPSRASQAVFGEELMRKSQNQSENAGGYRTAHTIRRDGEQHAIGGACGHIDAVIPDAMARDDGDAAARKRIRGDARPEYTQSIVRSAMDSTQFFADLGQKLPLKVRLGVENLQCCGVEYRLPIRTQGVAGNANLECTVTHWPPPFAFFAF